MVIDPEAELQFKASKGDVSGQLKSSITITNTSKGNLAFKVKTTAPLHYVVKPNQGIIDVNGKITVDIAMIQPKVHIIKSK